MAQPKLLHLPTLPKIHLTDPHIAKALQEIVRYLNANVKPKTGNKV